jgi:DnaK suppressor protein
MTMAKAKKLTKKDLKKFKEILEGRRDKLAELVDETRQQIGFSREDLPDEVDLATTESGQAMNLILRDRERVLLRKIDKALEKIETGQYGLCENCGDVIEVKRLEARPVTDMCILCKEEQEQRERSFAE